MFLEGNTYEENDINHAITLGTASVTPYAAYAASDKYEFESGIIKDTGENVTAVIAVSGADGGEGC